MIRWRIYFVRKENAEKGVWINQLMSIYSCDTTKLLHRFELCSAKHAKRFSADGSSRHMPSSELCRPNTSSILVPVDRSEVRQKVWLTWELSNLVNFRHFYQCGLQGSPPVWAAFIMTCQCSTFFDYEWQSCQSLWDWIPWCRNHPVPLPPVTPCWSWLWKIKLILWTWSRFIQ